MRGLGLEGPGSLQSRLHAALRGAINEGRLRPGKRLPSTRGLAESLGISRNTVLAAFARLEEEGLVESRRGSGTRVAPASPAAAPAASTARDPCPDLPLSRFGRRLRDRGIVNPYASMLAHRPLPFDFIYGIPPVQELPHDVWRRLVARVARRRPLLSFMYGPAEGSPALRRAIASHLTSVRGIRCDEDDVLVGGGFQEAVDLAARLLLDPGDRVVIEEALSGTGPSLRARTRGCTSSSGSPASRRRSRRPRDAREEGGRRHLSRGALLPGASRVGGHPPRVRRHGTGRHPRGDPEARGAARRPVAEPQPARRMTGGAPARACGTPERRPPPAGRPTSSRPSPSPCPPPSGSARGAPRPARRRSA